MALLEEELVSPLWPLFHPSWSKVFGGGKTSWRQCRSIAFRFAEDRIGLAAIFDWSEAFTVEIDVKNVAMLARIRLTDEEAAELGPQLARIVGYVEQLADVDTEGVAPTAHPHDVAMPLRADVVVNGNQREALQVPAPKTEAGLYVVPKVIE